MKVSRLWIIFAAISGCFAIAAACTGCTTAEWAQIGQDALVEAQELPQEIAENPTPVGLILALVGAVFVVFNKSARRGFGKAATATINKPISWLVLLLSWIKGIFTKSEDSQK